MTNQRFSLLVGLATLAAVGGALPVQATQAPTSETAGASEAAVVTLDLAAAELKQPKTAPLFVAEMAAPEAIAAPAATPEAAPAAEAAPEAAPEAVDPAAIAPLDPTVGTTADLLLEAPVSDSGDTSMLTAFDTAGIDAALNNGAIDAGADLSDGVEIAQSTRRAYQGVSPAYLGVGGNFGFGDPKSATGDFGFAVISKISLGPRFSLRPSVIISERYVSAPIPLTYNFNMTRLGSVRFQPYVGAGVDVSDNVALLLDAGIDVPVSRDFTINATTNWRVTSGFAFGLVLGVAYNFPFIFE